jgi:hypothetical protein
MVCNSCLRIDHLHSTTTITGVLYYYQRREEGAAQPQYKRLHFDWKVDAVMLAMPNKYYALDIRLCTAAAANCYGYLV